MKKRFKNVVKFFNYVRTNRIAPISVKLKVLNTCVLTLLHNCETFGPSIPEGLEELYHKMLRAALGVRSNCPTLLLLMESGCLPLNCLILSRQLNFFRRFKDSLQPNSCRVNIFSKLLENSSTFLKHYTDLDTRYVDSVILRDDHMQMLKDKITNFATNKEKHYKYWIYLKLNPELVSSSYLNRADRVGKCITKFRLGTQT